MTKGAIMGEQKDVAFAEKGTCKFDRLGIALCVSSSIDICYTVTNGPLILIIRFSRKRRQHDKEKGSSDRR